MNKTKESATETMTHLIPKNSWCEKHWSRIVKNPKINGVNATVAMIGETINNDEFARKCGWDPDKGTQANRTLMDKNLDMLSPLCCNLGDEKMEEIYFAATEEEGEA